MRIGDTYFDVWDSVRFNYLEPFVKYFVELALIRPESLLEANETFR